MIDEGKQGTVERYFAAISTLDADALVEVFAPDGELQDPVGAKPVVGEDALRRFMASIIDNFDAMVLTPDESFHSGGEVAVRWTGRGRSKQGVEVEYAGVDVFAFDDQDRVTLMKGYWDPKALFAQLKAGA
jgi:steroid Delta-isomerase